MSVLCAHREDLESVALVLKKPLSLLRIVLGEWLVGYSRVGYSRLSYSRVGYSCVSYSCIGYSCVGYSCGPIISAQDLSPKQTAAFSHHHTCIPTSSHHNTQRCLYHRRYHVLYTCHPRITHS